MKQLSRPEITALAQKYPNIVGYGLGSEDWPLDEIAWIAGEDEHIWQELETVAREQTERVPRTLSGLRSRRVAFDAFADVSDWLQRLGPQMERFAQATGEFFRRVMMNPPTKPGYHYPPRPRNGYNMSARRKGTS